MKRGTPFERLRRPRVRINFPDRSHRPRARHRLLTALAVLLGAALLAPPRAHGSDLDGDLFEDRKLDVKFTVPEGWRLTRQTGYPSLLAFVSRDSSRIALSFTRLGRQQKIIQIVTDNSRALEALGLRVEQPQNTVRLGRKLWQVSAHTADGRRANQQLYVPAGQVVYVLTLSTPTKEIQRAQLDLDYLLASMKFKRWPLAGEALVREQGRQGAKKVPPTTSRKGLPELSSGALPTEAGEKSQTRTSPTKAGPREVEERAKGRRQRPREGRPTRPHHSSRASTSPTSASSNTPATRPSAKTAPKLPTATSQPQTR